MKSMILLGVFMALPFFLCVPVFVCPVFVSIWSAFAALRRAIPPYVSTENSDRKVMLSDQGKLESQDAGE